MSTDRQGSTIDWYLVQCKPRDSFRAKSHLDEQGYRTYLPTHSVKRKHARRVYYQTEPLFPHYLFLETSAESNWAAIRSTRGVSRIVSFNGRPIPVCDEIVLGLRQQCAILAGQEPEPIFRQGQKVVITDGCFRELEAIVQTTRGDERVILLLSMLNRQQRVELPVSSVATR